MRRWLRCRPRLADGLLALVIFTVAATVRPDRAPGLIDLDPWTLVLLALACGALVFRRTHPLAVWAWTLTAGVVGVSMAGGPSAVVLPAFVALYSVASGRPRRLAVLAALGTAATLVAAVAVAEVDSWQSPTTYALLAWSGMVAAIGVAVKGQRAVVAAAEDRARQAEASREEEAERRVTEERLRIARDVHDVMAHHISVINVQAGVARHLLGTRPAEASEALNHVRESSQMVLSELTMILGLLRTSDDGGIAQPAPGLAQVEELIESMRHAGLQTTWRICGTPRVLPPVLDLTAYRIVQESLTNAHKHGSGRADVAIDYRPLETIIEASNPVRAGGTDELVDGHGIVGIRERVSAVGGSLAIGPTRDGRFIVRAALPEVAE